MFDQFSLIWSMLFARFIWIFLGVCLWTEPERDCYSRLKELRPFRLAMNWPIPQPPSHGDTVDIRPKSIPCQHQILKKSGDCCARIVLGISGSKIVISPLGNIWDLLQKFYTTFTQPWQSENLSPVFARSRFGWPGWKRSQLLVDDVDRIWFVLYHPGKMESVTWPKFGISKSSCLINLGNRQDWSTWKSASTWFIRVAAKLSKMVNTGSITLVAETTFQTSSEFRISNTGNQNHFRWIVEIWHGEMITYANIVCKNSPTKKQL